MIFSDNPNRKIFSDFFPSSNWEFFSKQMGKRRDFGFGNGALFWPQNGLKRNTVFECYRNTTGTVFLRL